MNPSSDMDHSLSIEGLKANDLTLVYLSNELATSSYVDSVLNKLKQYEEQT